MSSSYDFQFAKLIIPYLYSRCNRGNISVFKVHDGRQRPTHEDSPYFFCDCVRFSGHAGW